MNSLGLKKREIGRQEFLQFGRFFINSVLGPLFGEHCPACGHRTLRRRGNTFPPELISEWGLVGDWKTFFVDRETVYCFKCKANLRSIQYASTLVREYNRIFHRSTRSLSELVSVPEFQELRIAEINGVGRLHELIKHHANLNYSEYGSSDPEVPSEDLTQLSYTSKSFDLVLTSETLEHVPDLQASLHEIARILKEDGLHICTIPVRWDRSSTLQRARSVNGHIVHDHPPSYHGERSAKRGDMLVFYEFGSDIVRLIEAAGFDVQVEQDAANPSLATFICRTLT